MLALSRGDRRTETLAAHRLAQNELVAGLCAERGIAFLDLTPALEAEVESGRNVYFPDDAHWNADGHRQPLRLVLRHEEVARHEPLADDDAAEDDEQDDRDGRVERDASGAAERRDPWIALTPARPGSPPPGMKVESWARTVAADRAG